MYNKLGRVVKFRVILDVTISGSAGIERINFEDIIAFRLLDMYDVKRPVNQMVKARPAGC